jgi:hypothetical protein
MVPVIHSRKPNLPYLPIGFPCFDYLVSASFSLAAAAISSLRNDIVTRPVSAWFGRKRPKLPRPLS